ncbi:MAG: lipopolysaccharide heptosyltransferase I [Casimicrobiaceae bacterium]|nr:lipopolysaccharide heptosyltransferase I [Casimicrobiaceae bacterium]
MKILLVKTSSMGDVVHTLPAVSDIARHLPGALIDWLVEKPFAPIPALHPAVRRVVPIAWRRWRKSLWSAATLTELREARRTLREERYDLVLDLQGLAKSALWALQARGPVHGYGFGSAREWLAPLFYARRSAVEPTLHAIERSRQLAALSLGYRPDGAAEFGIAAPPWGWRPCREPYAVLVTGASRASKLWPENRWLQVARKLLASGLWLVWLWGNSREASRCVALAAQSDGDVPPFLGLSEAAAVLGRARLCVGLDTGFSHLAAALGVPTVGIYCDHDPALVGLRGRGYVASLGARGRPPETVQVLEAIRLALEARPNR